MIQTGRHHEIFKLADGRELTRKCSALLMGIICRKSLVAEFMGRDIAAECGWKEESGSKLRQSQGSGFWVTARDRRLFQGGWTFRGKLLGAGKTTPSISCSTRWPRGTRWRLILPSPERSARLQVPFSVSVDDQRLLEILTPALLS